MNHPGANSWSDGVPQPQPPEVDVEYDLQWVDFSEDLERFGRMGMRDLCYTCSLTNTLSFATSARNIRFSEPLPPQFRGNSQW